MDGVLTGRVLQRGDTLAVQADLVRVSDGSQLWGDRFDRKLADLLAIQDEIAKQIADRLRVRLTGEEQQLITRRYTGSTEAYDLYLKGRYFYAKLTEEGLDKSISYYREAIAIDPSYALCLCRPGQYLCQAGWGLWVSVTAGDAHTRPAVRDQGCGTGSEAC